MDKKAKQILLASVVIISSFVGLFTSIHWLERKVLKNE
jgi:hypothetical protein